MKLFWLIIFLPLLAVADTTVVVDHFEYGLNTKGDPFDLAPGEALVAHNVDLTRDPGSIRARLGYDEVREFAGIDTFLWNGLYTVNYLNGDRELLIVGDSNGVGFANVYASGVNSLAFTTSAADSVWIAVDTSAIYHYVRTNPYYSPATSFTMRIMATHSSTVDTVEITFPDTAYSAADIVDSFIIEIGKSTCTTWVTESDQGDTILLIENANYYTTEIEIEPVIGSHPLYDDWWTMSYTGGGEADNRVATYVPAVGRLWWEQYEDWTYFGTGVSKSYAYDGRNIHTFPTLAPGEIESIPLAKSGPLQGHYRYAIKWTGGAPSDSTDTLTTNVLGYISTPVVCDSQQVLLRNFPPLSIDYWHDTTDLQAWKTIAGAEDSYNYACSLLFGSDTLIAEWTSPASATTAAMVADSMAMTINATSDMQDSVVASRSGDTLVVTSLSALCQPWSVLGLDDSLAVDSLTDTVAVEDSVTIQIWRTVGDVGTLDKLDTIFFTGIETSVTAATYNTVTITDSVSDDSLRTFSGDSVRVILDGEFYAFRPDTIDDHGGTVRTYEHYHKPGAPVILSTAVRADSGIWKGIDDWRTVAGFQWFVVFNDTTQNVPSDSGLTVTLLQTASPDTLFDSSCVNCGAADETQLGFCRDSTGSVSIVLPRSNENNVVALLYRAPLQNVKYDSTLLWSKTIFHIGFSPLGIMEVEERKKFSYFGRDFYPYEGAYLIGQYSPGDTITDTLCYDSLTLRAPYKRNAVPPILTDMVVYGRYFVGTDGVDIYISNVIDTALGFSLFNRQWVSPNDGDAVTTLIEARTSLRAMKNRSSYALYQASGDTLFLTSELSGHYGCVAPMSYTPSPEGHYFLSAEGVRLETEGVYNPRAFNAPLMSSQLTSFESQSLSELKDAFGFYFDNKYMLSIPGLDTMWVLNKVELARSEPVYGWTTWGSISMIGATKYRTTSDYEIMPGDTMYFLRANDDALYVFGTQDKDPNVYTSLPPTTLTGGPIEWEWKSGYLLPVNFQYYQVDEFGALLSCVDTNTYVAAATAVFYDERGDSSYSGYIDIDRADTASVFRYSQPPLPEGLSWQVDLSGTYAIDKYGRFQYVPVEIKKLYLRFRERDRYTAQ